MNGSEKEARVDVKVRTAKEKVLERHPKARLAVNPIPRPYVFFVYEDETNRNCLAKTRGYEEEPAWESAAAMLEPEPKEVTLTELIELGRMAHSVSGSKITITFACDYAHRDWCDLWIDGRGFPHNSTELVAKLRELATPTPKPPELPDMIPVMLSVEFLANFSGTAWATSLYRHAADSCRDALAKARAAKPEPPPVSKPIEWFECLNEDSNTIWFAQSPMVRECRSLRWRLVSKLFDNRIQWESDHDSGLGCENCLWPTIGEAKAAIQAAHDAIVRGQKEQK